MKHCVPVLGLILLATSAAGQTSRPASTPASTPTSRPTATGSKEALLLAQRVFDYAGGQALSKAHHVVFTFQAGQRSRRLFWDFRARKVRVEYPDPPRCALGAPISVLVFAGSRTLGELASAEQVRPSTKSVIVRALEEDDLVARKPSRDDGRAVILRATAKGRRMIERARQRRLTLLEELLTECTPRDVDPLGRAAELIEQIVSLER